ncbi:MAG: NFACT family protein [Lachnospiraceae bacterium]|nr:NFACT family protein [Lachnospiraceae bacterium]
MCSLLCEYGEIYKMAFDGFCIKRIVKEYNDIFTDSRISKIIQNNNFDIILVIKKGKDTYNLFVSANPSMSYTYLVSDKGEAPKNALNFCMLLRKYIANGKILSVTQKDNERIIVFEIEHLDEMGDLSVKKLIFELMGKHSNIILTDENDIILDSIKRVNELTSSLREVLPKKEYFFPSDLKKINPYETDLKNEIVNIFDSYSEEEKSKLSLSSLLVNSFEGVSKNFAKEVLFRAGKIQDTKLVNTDNDILGKVSDSFEETLKLTLEDKCFYEYIKDGKLFDYSTFRYEYLNDECECKEHSDMMLSEFLSVFYSAKHDQNVILQKSNDIVSLLNSHISKNKKKIAEWEKELFECENKETLKKYGELLKAYSHSIQRGKSANVLDYYTGENIDIPLDENKTVIENSNKYFNDYSKAKRRENKIKELLDQTDKETKYLEDLLLYISLSENTSDINQIRQELYNKGYIKKNAVIKEKKKSIGIKHYIYDNNYHIYVGKNNIQNEEVTFKVATGNDWWFHAKGIAGSHVIVKSDKDNSANEWDMPDELFELCGALAAINSSHSGLSKVEIDYTRKKHIKKPAEGEKGMVIYHTYYSLVALPDISRFSLTSVNS